VGALNYLVAVVGIPEKPLVNKSSKLELPGPGGLTFQYPKGTVLVPVRLLVAVQGAAPAGIDVAAGVVRYGHVDRKTIRVSIQTLQLTANWATVARDGGIACVPTREPQGGKRKDALVYHVNQQSLTNSRCLDRGAVQGPVGGEEAAAVPGAGAMDVAGGAEDGGDDDVDAQAMAAEEDEEEEEENEEGEGGDEPPAAAGDGGDGGDGY
jgi:hypothetical protein